MMPYEMVHDTDDVVLTTWQERDRIHVGLYFKHRGDQGDDVHHWRDHAASEAFEEGFLKAGRRPGGLRDDDDVLLASALEYAASRRLATVSAHAARVTGAVSALEEALPAAYAALDAAEPEGEDEDCDVRLDRLVEDAVEAAVARDAFLSGLSDSRREDIGTYLVDGLTDALRRAASPAP